MAGSDFRTVGAGGLALAQRAFAAAGWGGAEWAAGKQRLGAKAPDQATSTAFLICVNTPAVPRAIQDRAAHNSGRTAERDANGTQTGRKRPWDANGTHPKTSQSLGKHGLGTQTGRKRDANGTQMRLTPEDEKEIFSRPGPGYGPHRPTKRKTFPRFPPPTLRPSLNRPAFTLSPVFTYFHFLSLALGAPLPPCLILPVALALPGTHQMLDIQCSISLASGMSRCNACAGCNGCPPVDQKKNISSFPTLNPIMVSRFGTDLRTTPGKPKKGEDVVGP